MTAVRSCIKDENGEAIFIGNRYEFSQNRKERSRSSPFFQSHQGNIRANRKRPFTDYMKLLIPMASATTAKRRPILVLDTPSGARGARRAPK